jgi:hypothetical protein
MNTAVIERTTKPAPDARQTKSRQPFPLLLLKIVAMQVVAILFVEAVLFCAGLGEEEIFKLDPLLGSAHLTNKRVTWRSEGYSVSWFNEVGMRESGITVAKPPGTLRIALLGDSLTESLQVPLEKTFGQIMEGKLKDQLHMPIQVLNFGVSGYSTAQEYLVLKQKVLQYKPDVVLACYNSRDSFENWSAPDQVITNVRPYALHLPGGKLTIDTSPVTNWMKTPRAKFLRQFEWLRQNSRLWGLFAAVELDWSMHNETYKYVSLLLTRPGKGIKEIWKRLRQEAAKHVPLQVATTETSPGPATSAESKKVAPASKTAAIIDKPSTGAAAVRPAKANSTAGNAALATTTHAKEAASTAKVAVAVSSDKKAGIAAKEPSPSNTSKPEKKNERPGYQQFIMRSLGSLLEEMQKETMAATGGQFAVIAMPVRSALCPAEGIDTAFNDFTYKDEVVMLKEICAEKKIPLVDLEKPAEKFEFNKRKDMFYSVHLTAPGHEYVGEKLSEFVKPYLAGARQDVPREQ